MKMGASASSFKGSGDKLKNGMRQMSIPTKVPMPNPEELEVRFLKVLASMDLPPDKARLLKGYDNEKKWELVCDQERVIVKESPESYLQKLLIFLDPLAHKNSKTLKILNQSNSTQILRNLEISLRTNHIEWVRLFLSDEHNGLNILIDYLSLTQDFMRLEQWEKSSGEGNNVLDRGNEMIISGNPNSPYFLNTSTMSLPPNTKPPTYSTYYKQKQNKNSKRNNNNNNNNNNNKTNSRKTNTLNAASTANYNINDYSSNKNNNNLFNNINNNNNTIIYNGVSGSAGTELPFNQSGRNRFNSAASNCRPTTGSTLRADINKQNYQIFMARAASMRRSKHSKSSFVRAPKVQFGYATDDVHLCIMCLRAIMNHQYGFNLVFVHPEAINCITLSLNHKNYRTKTLVLELMAAVCLVSGGHDIILHALDNFKEVCRETHRFETLMHYFQNYEEFHIDFMVACMQFINIIVHSVENMNFRVHLQHEFSLLGLDDYLQKLRHTESDRLPVQVNAYLDNTIDVQTLLEESDMKTVALEKVGELEDELSHMIDRLQQQEDSAFDQINQLSQQLGEVNLDRECLKGLCQKLNADLEQLKLGRNMSSVSNETIINPYVPEKRTPVPPPRTSSVNAAERNNIFKNEEDHSSLIPTPPPLAPPLPPMAPPLPPQAPPFLPGGEAMFSIPVAPMMMAGPGAMTIKKLIQPNQRLPVLNWVSMKPNEVKGTMFSDLDDEKLYKVLDFVEFEEHFKLGTIGGGAMNGGLSNDEVDSNSGVSLKIAKKKVEKMSLLESNRMRNCAITRRKIELRDDEIVKAINSLDLQRLTQERVEILLRVVPNEQEVKLLKEYEKDKKPLDMLADEDRFMLNLMKVERLQQKLTIMYFIGSFMDSFHNLHPQLLALLDASNSIRESKKLRKLFEIILAFGNYMNSCKRGAVYGFRLQSLDMLSDTKSSNKKFSLLQFIVKSIKSKFPELSAFDAEIRHLEKASGVSLENVITDIQELERGMELMKRELEFRKDHRGGGDVTNSLKEFLTNADEKIKKLKVDCKSSQDAYQKVVEYFGENTKTLTPNTFFSTFLRFIKSFKQADIDLETQTRLEEAQKTARVSVLERSKKGNKIQNQESVVGELKQKHKQIKEQKVLSRDQVYHGALEDILSGLKNEPYRRADAVRRSLRKKNTGSDNRNLNTNSIYAV